MKINADMASAMLSAAKTALDGGNLYYFAGPVPATAGEALDMVDDHTQLVVFTESGDEVTGLTFDTPADNVMSKAAGEAWSGLIAFDGAEDGEATLTPTFLRFCPIGDNGRGAASGPRVQMTVGGPSSSAEMKLGDGTTLTANGTNTRTAAIFFIDLQTLGG